ncbi:unnamed protein product [Ophioblennius macclurei]
MSQHSQAADWLSTVAVNTSETLPGFNTEVGPAHSTSPLQSACLFCDTATPFPDPSAWSADSSCQSLTWAAPLLVPPLYAGGNSYYGNVHQLDWLLPGCLPKGRGYGPAHLQCVCCGTSSTSLWRRDAAGRHLCNSCSSQRTRWEDTPLLKPKRRAVATQKKFSRCVNCKTERTTLWRRNSAGQQLCNACGLYFKLHQVDRPLSLKKDRIQTRSRKKQAAKSRPGREPANRRARSSG